MIITKKGGVISREMIARQETRRELGEALGIPGYVPAQPRYVPAQPRRIAFLGSSESFNAYFRQAERPVTFTVDGRAFARTRDRDGGVDSEVWLVNDGVAFSGLRFEDAIVGDVENVSPDTIARARRLIVAERDGDGNLSNETTHTLATVDRLLVRAAIRQALTSAQRAGDGETQALYRDVGEALNVDELKGWGS